MYILSLFISLIGKKEKERNLPVRFHICYFMMAFEEPHISGDIF